MTATDDIAKRLRANAAATRRGEYDDLEAAVEAAADRIGADANEAEALVGALVDVLAGQVREVSTADALVHDTSRANAIEYQIARLLEQISLSRPSFVLDHARDLAAVAIEQDGSLNDAAMALSSLAREHPAAFAACCRATAEVVDDGEAEARSAAFTFVADLVELTTTWLPSDAATEPSAAYAGDAESVPETPPAVRDAAAVDAVATAAVSAVDADAPDSQAAARAYATVARAAPDAALPGTPWVAHAVRTASDADLRAPLLNALAALATARPAALTSYRSTLVDALTDSDERVRETAGEALSAVAYREQGAVLEILPAVAAVVIDDLRGTAPALEVLSSAAKGDAYSPDAVPDAVLDVVDSVTAVLDATDADILEPATGFLETVADTDAALDHAPALAAPDTVEALVDLATRDPGGLTQLHATRVLRAVLEWDPGRLDAILDALVDRLDADPVERRVGALEAIDSILNAPSSTDLARQEAPAYRRLLHALVDALGSSTHKLTVDTLTSTLGRNPDALRFVHDDVEDALTATESHVRVAGYEVVTAAASEGSTTVLAFEDAIERGLADDDPVVVNAALEVASEVTPEHHEAVTPLLPAVAACLDDDDTRRTAAQVLSNVSTDAPSAVLDEREAILTAFADTTPTADPDDTLDVTRHLAAVLSNVVDADPTVVVPVTEELAALGRTMTHQFDQTASDALEALGVAATESQAARDALLTVYERGTPMAANAAATYVRTVVEEAPAAADALVPRLCERDLETTDRIDALAACAKRRPAAVSVAVPALRDVAATEDLDERTALVARALDALSAVAAADESAVQSVVPVAVEVLFETTETPAATAAVEALADLVAAHPAATRAALPTSATDSPVDLLDVDLTADVASDAVRRGLAATDATERFEAAFAYRTLAADDPDAAVSLLDAVVAHVETEPRLTRLQLYGAVDMLAESHPDPVSEALPALVDGVLTTGPTPTVAESGFTDALAFPLVDALVEATIARPERVIPLVDRVHYGLDAPTRGERVQSAPYLAMVAVARTEAPDHDGLANALEDAEPALRSLLDGTDLERQIAAFALTGLQTALPDTLPVLREILEQPAHPFAEETIEMLTLVTHDSTQTLAATPGSVEALLAGADHQDSAVRAGAVGGLGAIARTTGNERATAAVGKVLTDPASDVREEAARAIGHAPRQLDPLDPALPGLARALASDDETVRQAATDALEFHSEPSDRDLDAAALIDAVANADDAVTAPALSLLAVIARNRPQDVVDAGLDPIRDELQRPDTDSAGDALRVVDELAEHVPAALQSLVPALGMRLHRNRLENTELGLRHPNRVTSSILESIAEEKPTAAVDVVPELAEVFFETAADEMPLAVHAARGALQTIATERPDAVASTVEEAVTALESVDATRRKRGLDLLAALVYADVVPIQAVRPTATALVADDDPDVGEAAADFLEGAVYHTEATRPEETVPVLLDATQSGDPDRRGEATAALAAIAKDTPDAVPIEPIRDLLTADDYTTAGSAIHCLQARKDAVDLTAGERAVVQETLSTEADQRTRVVGIDLLAATDTTAATTPQ
ncbi:HEAT repeat domain-containing protein [Halorubellus litoreus]|uniref:HEAT repeat domain-containing protein n=1 Tax=Halorubellus litoreus TaxID=755308 RepID=A0ABD5VM16_9EURY